MWKNHGASRVSKYIKEMQIACSQKSIVCIFQIHLCPVCDGVFRNADVPLTTEENILADAMIALAQDKEMRLKYSKKGLLRAQDFGIEKILPEYIEVLESV